MFPDFKIFWKVRKLASFKLTSRLVYYRWYIICLYIEEGLLYQKYQKKLTMELSVSLRKFPAVVKTLATVLTFSSMFSFGSFMFSSSHLRRSIGRLGCISSYAGISWFISSAYVREIKSSCFVHKKLAPLATEECTVRTICGTPPGIIIAWSLVSVTFVTFKLGSVPKTAFLNRQKRLSFVYSKTLKNIFHFACSLLNDSAIEYVLGRDVKVLIDC